MSPGVFTLTLNPVIDRELTIAEFTFNSVLKAETSRTDCGGKGINVARALAGWGIASSAVAFAGGPPADLMRTELTRLAIQPELVPISGETRTNTSIVAGDGRHIKVNEPGPHILPGEAEELLRRVSGLAQEGDWWALCGSLPPGLADDFYAEIIRLLHRKGVKTLLDCAGAALSAGWRARPEVLKVNVLEAAELTDRDGNDPEALPAMLQTILAGGVRTAVISLGAQGAVLVEGEQRCHARPPAIREANPIGAGDALTAGLLYARLQGQPWPQALCWGVAAGTAAAALPGTRMPTLAGVEQIQPQVTLEFIPTPTFRRNA